MSTQRLIPVLLASCAATLTAVAMSAPSAIAQDACYMVTASGKRISLGTLCGETLPSSKPSDGIYRVKIKKRLASTPVIEVRFNGKPFDMILDTGASSTLITQQMATALGLQPMGYRRVIIADGSMVKFPVSTVGSVSAGGLTSKDLVVTIADKADIGLLGHDFFGQYDVQIKRNVVEFHPQSE